MVSPYEERPTLSYHFDSRAVSTNRRFVLRRPDHFPNGVVATIDNIRPFLFALAIFKKQPSCSQAHPFHPRGWPAGPWGLSYRLAQLSSFFQWRDALECCVGRRNVLWQNLHPCGT